MPRRPTPSFDYEYLALLDSDENSPGELFFLRESSQAVLSQLAEIVLWTSSRWYNGDPADIESLAAEIYEELKVPLHLDDLIPLIDDVESLLRGLQFLTGCCPENLAPESTKKTTEYTPSNPPSTWGDGEPVADAADYQDILCYAAHNYVDHLRDSAKQVDDLVTAGAMVLAGIAGLLGLLAGGGILAAIEYGFAAGVVSGLAAAATAETFDGVKDQIESMRADLVCEITKLDEEAFRDILETQLPSLAWNLFFRWVDYSTAFAVLAEGELNGQYLEAGRREDCPCDITTLFTEYTNFGTLADGWGTWSPGGPPRSPTLESYNIKQYDSKTSRGRFTFAQSADNLLTVQVNASRRGTQPADFRIEVWIDGGVRYTSNPTLPASGIKLCEFTIGLLATDDDIDEIRIKTNQSTYACSIYDARITVWQA